MASLSDSQLSALAANIDDLALRVTQLAEGLDGYGVEETSTALFEVERSLQMASRSMARARKALPPR